MYKKMNKYFTSGLLTALPLIIIYQIIKSFAGIFKEFFPSLHFILSFSLSVVFMIFLGFLVNKFLSKNIRKILHKKSKEKGMLSGFSKIILHMKILSEKTKDIFKNPILYKVDDGIYKLGFVSNNSFEFISKEWDSQNEKSGPENDSVWVFTPSPISFSGDLQLIAQKNIRKIERTSKEDLSFFILTAGISKNTKK